MVVQQHTCTFNAADETLPNWIICGTTRLTVSMGMAKPTPAEVPDGVKMAVLTPMTAPLQVGRGGMAGRVLTLMMVSLQVGRLVWQGGC